MSDMLDVESWAVATAQDSAATKESDSDKKETGKTLHSTIGLKKAFESRRPIGLSSLRSLKSAGPHRPKQDLSGEREQLSASFPD